MALIVLCCWLILGISILNAEGSKLNQAIDSYGFRLFNENSKNVKNENAILSPRSIVATVFLAYLGSGGQTKAEMSQAIFGNMTERQIGDQLEHFVTSLTHYTQATVQSATGILVNRKKHFSMNRYYWDIVSKMTEVQAITDFGNEDVRQYINRKNFEKRDQIKDYIEASLWDSDSALLLLNKIYFKCDWAQKFDSNLSIQGKFRGLDWRNAPVRMMVQKNKTFGYYRTKPLSVLEVPYKEERLSMYLFLTDDIQQFYALENGIGGELLESISESIEETVMEEVQIPKFKIESKFDLKSLMRDTGINLMFDENADFGRMLSAGSTPVKVSDAEHSASIEVTEEGTEATAETTLKISSKMRGAKPKFIANHPFLFMVYDKSTKSALFIGRYVKSDQAYADPIKQYSPDFVFPE